MDSQANSEVEEIVNSDEDLAEDIVLLDVSHFSLSVASHRVELPTISIDGKLLKITFDFTSSGWRFSRQFGALV